MFKGYKQKPLLISLLISFSFLNLFQVFKVMAETNNKPKPDSKPPMHTCYKPMIMPTKVQQLEDLKLQLDNVEKLYSENKIDKNTFETRKESLQKQIEDLKN